MPIKTMQQWWREYRDACYPKGLSAIQNRECHQAFFAGALCAINSMNALSELPEDNAVAELSKLTAECVEICQARAFVLKTQN
jgi:hypothetical protein